MKLMGCIVLASAQFVFLLEPTFAQQKVENQVEVGLAAQADSNFSTIYTERTLIKVNVAVPLPSNNGSQKPESNSNSDEDVIFGHKYFMVETQIGLRNGKADYADIQISPARGQETLLLSQKNPDTGSQYYMEVTFAPLSYQRDLLLNMDQRLRFGLVKMHFTLISPKFGNSILGLRAYAGALGTLMNFGYLKTTDGIKDTNEVGGFFGMNLGYETGFQVQALNDGIRIRYEPLSQPTAIAMDAGDFLLTTRRLLSLEVGSRFQIFAEEKYRKYSLNKVLVSIPDSSPFANGNKITAKEWYLGATIKLGKKTP